MREFRDAQGRAWDVVLGRESWGALLALFVPVGVDRSEAVRQTMLRSDSYEAANRELNAMDEAQLAALFDDSQPKP